MAILSENHDTKILANLNLAVWSWPIVMMSCVYIDYNYVIPKLSGSASASATCIGLPRFLFFSLRSV